MTDRLVAFIRSHGNGAVNLGNGRIRVTSECRDIDGHWFTEILFLDNPSISDVRDWLGY